MRRFVTVVCIFTFLDISIQDMIKSGHFKKYANRRSAQSADSVLRVQSLGIHTRPAQIFLGFPPPTPRWSLGKNVPGNQFSANSEVIWPRHRGSEGPQNESEWDLPGDLRSLRDVVKRLPNWLKIGFQARFGPNFTVDLEAEIPKKIGLA